MHPLVQTFFERYGRLPTERDPDYLEMLRMSKFRIIPIPDFKPHKCANCGSTKKDGRTYIDFGCEIEWYGTVYFCSFCITEIATKMGCFEKLETELHVKSLEVELLKEKLNKKEELPKNLVQAWEEMKEYYASVHPVGDDSNTVTSDSSSDSLAVQEPHETPAYPIGNSAAKSRATKSTSSSRRSDVPSLADLLKSE